MTDLHARLAENEAVISGIQSDFWYSEDAVTSILEQHGMAASLIETDARFISTSGSEWPRANAALRKVLRVADRLDELADGTYGAPECRLARAEAALWIRAAIEEAMSDDDIDP